MLSYDVEKPKSSHSRLFRRLSGWPLLILPLFLFVMIVWRPILVGISYSFFQLKGFQPEKFVGLLNFYDILTDTTFLQTLWNTVLYVIWSLVIGLPLPIIAALMLNEMIHAKEFFKFSLYIPCIIPAIAVSLIWKLMYLDGSGGMLNMFRSFLGLDPAMWLGNKNLVIPLIIISTCWNGFGSTMIIYLASLQGINHELYEATRLDGAGFLGRVMHVAYPHMRSLILLMTIRQIIGVFQIMEQPLAMTGGGPNGASMSLGLTGYFYAFRLGQFEKSIAVGVISFVLMLGLTIVYVRTQKKFEI